jgi:flagella basal body P-ring formation protein FlgA
MRKIAEKGGFSAESRGKALQLSAVGGIMRMK